MPVFPCRRRGALSAPHPRRLQRVVSAAVKRRLLQSAVHPRQRLQKRSQVLLQRMRQRLCWRQMRVIQCGPMRVILTRAFRSWNKFLLRLWILVFFVKYSRWFKHNSDVWLLLGLVARGGASCSRGAHLQHGEHFRGGGARVLVVRRAFGIGTGWVSASELLWRVFQLQSSAALAQLCAHLAGVSAQPAGVRELFAQLAETWCAEVRDSTAPRRGAALVGLAHLFGSNPAALKVFSIAAPRDPVSASGSGRLAPLWRRYLRSVVGCQGGWWRHTADSGCVAPCLNVPGHGSDRPSNSYRCAISTI